MKEELGLLKRDWLKLFGVELRRADVDEVIESYLREEMHRKLRTFVKRHIYEGGIVRLELVEALRNGFECSEAVIDSGPASGGGEAVSGERVEAAVSPGVSSEPLPGVGNVGGSRRGRRRASSVEE